MFSAASYVIATFFDGKICDTTLQGVYSAVFAFKIWTSWSTEIDATYQLLVEINFVLDDPKRFPLNETQHFGFLLSHFSTLSLPILDTSDLIPSP